MPGPYQSLADFLRAQPPEAASVTLTIAEIEALMREPLPSGAWTRQWWLARRRHGEARSWHAAGWRVTRVSMRMADPSVTFARLADGGG